MIEGLIKITDEENMFYDSEERLYRCRMHCPSCGDMSGCRCFETIEEAYEFIEGGCDYLCSCKCYLDDVDECELGEAMKEMGIICIKYKSRIPLHIQRIIRSMRYYLSIWRFKWYIYKYTGYISENDACEVIESMDLDFDSVGGMSC